MDPYEEAHNEPPQLDLHCLLIIQLFSSLVILSLDKSMAGSVDPHQMTPWERLFLVYTGFQNNLEK